ncbi:MAG TPA: hypothetical protein VGE60_00115 [Telluria sp.]
MEKPSQIAFRYRTSDSATGVSRATAKRLAAALGVDETQAIHIALRQLAAKVLPQYEADEGALLDDQILQIRSMVGTIDKRSVRSSLFDED